MSNDFTPYTREKANRQRNELKTLRRRAVVHALGGVCCICWETDEDCLDIHHSLKFADQKQFRLVANELSRSREELEEELSICMILCTNCHRKVHKGKLEEPKFRKRKVKITGKWRELWKE